jgi:HAD superfamily hydrolase (TIGR01509 family)
MSEPQTPAGFLRVAIFDVDGTLVTDTIHRDKHNFILGQVMHRPELMLTQTEWDCISGLADEDAYQYIAHKAERRSQGCPTFLAESTYLGIARRYVNTHLGQLHIRHGAYDIMSAAEDLGLLLGVATNADWAETSQKLVATGLLKYFRFFSCLDGKMAPKPAPDLYFHGIRTAHSLLGGELAPSSIIAFEDTETGATAAAAAGCRVVLWPDEKKKTTFSELSFNNERIIIARTVEDCLLSLRAAFSS